MNNFNLNRFNMKKIIFLLAFLFATITYAQTPARHYGGVILGSFANDPAGVSAGQIYWNTTNNKFRTFNGTIWSDLSGSTPTLSSVLAEGNTSGANDILLENDQKITFNSPNAPYDYYIGYDYDVVLNDKLKIFGEQVVIESVDGAEIILSDIVEVNNSLELDGVYNQNATDGGAMWLLNDLDMGIKTSIISDNWGNDNSFYMQSTTGLDQNLKHLIGYTFDSSPFEANLLIGANSGNSTPTNIKMFGEKYTLNGNEFLFNSDVNIPSVNKQTRIQHGYSISQSDVNENWGYMINGEEGFYFTDGLGNGRNEQSFFSHNFIGIGNNTFRGDIRATNLMFNRDYELPDASGTFALTSDIADYSDWLDYGGDTTTGNLSLKFGDYNNNSNGWYIELGQSSRYFGVGDIDELNNSTIFSVSDVAETYTFGGNNSTGAVFDVSSVSNVTLTFPDSSGQLALTSDLSGYVNLTTAQIVGGVKTFSNNIQMFSGSDILLNDNAIGTGVSRLQWNTNNYIEYDDQAKGLLEIKGGTNGIFLVGNVDTDSNNIYVGDGKVYTGGSNGSASIENDDLTLVRGGTGNPEVKATDGVIRHTIYFDVNNGSDTTLSTPNGYVGQIAVAHEKTPRIEIGSSGGTTNSIDGKDFYFLKFAGSNGNSTFNLPSAVTNQYRTLQFITNSTVSSNTTWTLDATGAETIDGAGTYLINRGYEGIRLWSDGTEWIIIQAKK